MSVPLQIRFQHLAPSRLLSAHIRNKANRLERYCCVTTCSVLVESATPKPTHPTFKVSIVTSMPWRTCSASAESDRDSFKEAFITVNEAFEKIEQQLIEQQRAIREQSRTAFTAGEVMR